MHPRPFPSCIICLWGVPKKLEKVAPQPVLEKIGGSSSNSSSSNSKSASVKEALTDASLFDIKEAMVN